MFATFTGGFMPARDGFLRGLPGWTADELRETLRQGTGSGADYDLDHATRFVRGVATVVRSREAVDRDKNDSRQLSVFLLQPSRDESLPHEPMLDRGLTPIAGKVWFVNAPVVSGRARALENEDAESVFKVVTQDLAMGEVPAVVVDPRLPSVDVRYYPKGLADPDSCVHVRLRGSDVDLRQVCEIIDRVFQCLVTPDAQPQANRLWKDADKGRPYRDAEHRVQAALYYSFRAEFASCRVYGEFKGTMGRADLHIAEHDPVNPALVTYLVVLELKVLRSRGESGSSYSEDENLDWVDKGVKQAGMYRQEHGHRVAVLCCFDMRDEDTGDDCFRLVHEQATALQVWLRRWYVYSSSERYREARAASIYFPPEA